MHLLMLSAFIFAHLFRLCAHNHTPNIQRSLLGLQVISLLSQQVGADNASCPGISYVSTPGWISRVNTTDHQRNSITKNDPSRLGVDKVKQFSGYLSDNARGSNVFYWFFESRREAAKDPVIIWFEGGPGCSSMLSLFQQLGPARVNENLQLTSNQFAWNSRASLLFIDQPGNTGFSTAEQGVGSTDAAAKNIFPILTAFFNNFPEYSKQDVYIAGSSYSGHYVPAIASEILGHKTRNINLKGAVIGNGCTDSLTLYPSYQAMACGGGGVTAVLDQNQCQNLTKAIPSCEDKTKACYASSDAKTCIAASDECDTAFIDPLDAKKANIYNLREPCFGNTSNFCSPVVEPIIRFLNQTDVTNALGTIKGRPWEVCNRGVSKDFRTTGDSMQSVRGQIANVVEQVPMLVFAGDSDFICNWLGVQAWTNALNWTGQDAFLKAPVQRISTRSNDTAKSAADYAEIKATSNLTFARVFNAGHFAVFDKPEETLDLLTRWIARDLAK